MDTLPHEKPIREYEKTIEHFKRQNGEHAVFDGEIQKLEEKLENLKEQVYAQLTAWERITICRHPARPHSSDYIRELCEEFTELHGDRSFADDHSIIGGVGVIGGQKFMILGQEKGKDTESRVHRNFGMLNPEGYRKALRLMKLAEKFHIPVLSFLDTPGAYPGLGAEERGQA
ncbi:MAG: acetyl-CoA carboxylase carboxyl transferase subunit alpha, partial [Chlamydiia bacterium]|nr:acetyl-CoA carboxylase carboxyl transferase subunit alpha [Chlamydiia bacterium]